MMLVFSALAAALSTGEAQAAAPSLLTPPPFSGYAFDPRADARHFLFTEDAQVEEFARVRILAAYDRDSVVSSYDLGQPGADAADERLALVGDVWTLHPVFTRGWGALRLTGGVPLYVRSQPDIVKIDGRSQRYAGTAAGSALGDAHIGVKGVMLDAGTAPIGLATFGRVAVPLGAADQYLGQPGVSGELGLTAQWLTARTDLGLSVAHRFLPKVDLGNIEVDDQLQYTLAGALDLGPGGITGELWGRAQYSGSGAGRSIGPSSRNNPVQVLAGGWLDTTRGGRVRLLGGTGLTSGLGAATVRVVLSVEQGLQKDRQSSSGE